MMQIERDQVYAPEHGERGWLDLYLPDGAPGCPVAMIERLREAGNHAELYLYDGPGVQHGIWRNDRPPLRFFKHLKQAIAGFLDETLETHC